MRLLFHDCLPLPILQRRQALCRQTFVVTLLTQFDGVDHLTIIDHYRSKLPESEGFVTAAIVTPKQRPSWNADRAWHETYFFCFLPAQVNPASLQVLHESLFFSDSEPPHSRHQVCSHLHSLPFLFDFTFHPCHFCPCLSVAALTFRIHGDAFHPAPRNCGFRLFRFTLRFQPPHTKPPKRSPPSPSFLPPNPLLPCHMPWKASTTQRT